MLLEHAKCSSAACSSVIDKKSLGKKKEFTESAMLREKIAGITRRKNDIWEY